MTRCAYDWLSISINLNIFSSSLLLVHFLVYIFWLIILNALYINFANSYYLIIWIMYFWMVKLEINADLVIFTETKLHFCLRPGKISAIIQFQIINVRNVRVNKCF